MKELTAAARIAAQEAAKTADVGDGWEIRFERVSDPDLRAAIKTLYNSYDAEGLIRWWAGLYDPVNGGFYYSNSGRDYEGFLPDMESTFQIGQRARSFDENKDLRHFLGDGIADRMVKFYQSKEDPEDGYFYHPQWSKAESRKRVMRYTRDLDWAETMLGWLGAEPLYPTANDRLAKGSGEETKPEQSEDWNPDPASVTAYVNNLFETKSTESWSNSLSTQVTAFQAAGVLGTVLDLLDKRAHPTYGVWVNGYDGKTDEYLDFRNEGETPYGVYTAAYKILVLYRAEKRPIPYPIPLAENAVKAIFSKTKTIRQTYVFNPWATLGLLRTLLVTVNDLDGVAAYDAYMKKNAVGMVNATIEKLAVYRQPDGSLSYLPDTSKETIYGTPVALPGLKEGDVNATNLSVSLLTHVCTAMGLGTQIPLFNREHAALFRRLLDEAKPIVKKPKPI